MSLKRSAWRQEENHSLWGKKRSRCKSSHAGRALWCQVLCWSWCPALALRCHIHQMQTSLQRWYFPKLRNICWDSSKYQKDWLGTWCWSRLSFCPFPPAVVSVWTCTESSCCMYLIHPHIFYSLAIPLGGITGMFWERTAFTPPNIPNFPYSQQHPQYGSPCKRRIFGTGHSCSQPWDPPSASWGERKAFTLIFTVRKQAQWNRWPRCHLHQPVATGSVALLVLQ